MANLSVKNWEKKVARDKKDLEFIDDMIEKIEFCAGRAGSERELASAKEHLLNRVKEIQQYKS
jgi:hypothetical protein